MVIDSLRINIKSVSLYAFCLALVYLAGSYFGGFLLYLYYLLLLLPFCSLILYITAFFGVKISQSFSTDHPVKGETIVYKVTLANELPIGVSQVKSNFVATNPMMTKMMPDFSHSLRRREVKKFIYDIKCSYRGIYGVGLESICIGDVMGLFSVDNKIWHTTFYVYPRIIPVHSFQFGLESYNNTECAAAHKGLADNTLLKTVREYRMGDGARHIYWKKMAATGRPVVKEFDTSTSPGVDLYLDAHNPDGEKNIETLEKEDVSVEILTALVKYYLEKRVNVTVRCPCVPVFCFKGNRINLFQDFYKQTVNLFFGDYESPVRLLKADRKMGALGSRSIIFITHRVDTDIFNFASRSVNSELRVLIIFNHTSSPEPVHEKNRHLFNSLRDRGIRILEVHSPGTIAEDLEKIWT